MLLLLLEMMICLTVNKEKKLIPFTGAVEVCCVKGEETCTRATFKVG